MDDGDRAVPRLESSTGDTDIRTFLIADVRGYTLFTQERGDEAAGKLASKFAELAREAVEARGGTLLELRGDEALCVFGSPRQAIRTAVDLQERFVEETLAAPELPLTVGIGLDAGEAVAVEGGYRGGALNLAARLCGQARAGEILASREVAHLARRVEGVRYEERGTLSLKGLAEPVHVVRVAAEHIDTVERLRSFATAPPPPPTPVWKRRRVLIPVVLAIALVAIWIPLLTSPDDTVEVDANSIALIDPEGSVEVSTPLGERLGASAIGFGSVWVAQPDRHRVVRVDLDDAEVVDAIDVGRSPAGVAVGDGSVWVSNAADGTVTRIDPGTNQPSEPFRAGSVPSGIAFGDGALWVTDTIGSELLRLDATGGVRSVQLSGQPSGVAFTSDGVWVTVAPAGIARVDPEELTVTLTQSVGSAPTAVLSAFDSIWVTNQLDGTVSRLDPVTGRELTKIPVGDGPNALAASNGSLWVANEFDGSISVIDPSTDDVERTLRLGGAVASLTSGGEGSLWLAVGASPTEHRGGTMRIAAEEEIPKTLDPALVYASFGWQLLSITNDGLLALKKVGGPDGTTLVPDLASAFPQVSPDGLTYRFPLRQDVTYSTGEPVRAEDFRYAFERALSLSPDTIFIYRAIRGADACAEDPSTCDLSRSIVAEDGAVTFHLSRPDTDFPFKLALPFAYPVPETVPLEDQGLEPVPATGPYMVEVAEENRIELVRNPRFREWSALAQPDGFVDAITWTFGQEPATSFERLTAGELDWMTDPPPSDDLDSLRAAHPDQVVLAPQFFTVFVGFDVAKAPMDDERLRQAVNYAIDRGHIVDLLGGPTRQRPTCQILPPNFQGYEPFCPYTLGAVGGVWSAPDVLRARELVDGAGAEGRKVTVWATDDPGIPGAIEVMRYITAIVDDLGLDAELEVVDFDRYVGTIYLRQRAGTPAAPDVYLGGWITDYPRAADFLDTLFRCEAGANTSGLCDERLDRRLEQAQQLQATDPAAANRAWTEIEHDLVDEALWAPLSNPVFASALSDRVGNEQIHPIWGLLLSRLWVQ